ncbi:MAG TPA: vWA domain-containing protein [Paraburkholderia sp.]|jgi:mxaC protein|nr:vWA domain-containing protein [Paraburkholderia sp.]
MNLAFDFAQPWALVLLPLAALPLLRRRGDTLPFSTVALLPTDRAGRIAALLLRALGVLAIGAIVVGLAGPGRSHVRVQHTGNGADILLLIDRSESMDEPINRTSIDAHNEPKNAVARRSLTRFIEDRPNDRFELMMFGISPIVAMPLTSDHAAVIEALDATRIGRGLPDTQMDRGLIAAIAQFDHRPLLARRAIVLVSDGGATLDDAARRRIAEGLARNHIALYFVYLRSGLMSPDLSATTLASGSNSAEANLHRYFLSLHTPYRLFQAADIDGMEQALAEINRQQHFPVSYVEQLPRQDVSRVCYALALAAAALLVVARFAQVRGW